MPSIRDDFPDPVKRAVAARVNFRCSNPECRAATTGPQIDPSKALNLGVAAHITAAAAGGPRFDLTITPRERRGISNAIWLCQNCGKLVDNDPVRFTAACLRQWKLAAEQEALTLVGKTDTTSEARSHSGQSQLSSSLLEQLESLPLDSRIYRDAITILGHGLFPRIMSLSGEVALNPLWPTNLDESHEHLIATFSPRGFTPPRVMPLDIFLIKASDTAARPCVLTYFSAKPCSGWKTFLFPFRQRRAGETDLRRLDLDATDLANFLGMSREAISTDILQGPYAASVKPDVGYGDLVLYLYTFCSVHLKRPPDWLSQRDAESPLEYSTRRFRWFHLEEMEQNGDIMRVNADLIRSIHSLFATTLPAVPYSVAADFLKS